MERDKKRIYQGLYGHDEIEFTKGLIHINPFGVIGKEHQNNVLQHVHNDLLQIFLIQEGTTNFLYSTQIIKVNQPTIITVPKNTEHGFEHQTDVNGWIISLSDVVLERMIYLDSEVVDALHDVQVVPIKKGSYAEEIEKIIYKCVLEYTLQKPGRLLMLEYLVGQLIVKLYRLPKNQKKKLNPSDSFSKIYYRKFIHLIKESWDYKKSIEQYANELGITAGHLNKICKNVASKSSKEVIAKYFIEEAKILLSDTDLSISEVCYRLGFEDKSYFSRVFKRKTALTPTQFKKSLEEKINNND